MADHLQRNRRIWDAWAGDYVAPARTAWARETPTWGIWGIPEADVGMLPPSMDGTRALELGCGAAYVGAWMARRGARVVGVDNSLVQLATATDMQRTHHLAFPLLHANAEKLPFADASFDFAISEYGASIWADPELWIAEAARVLRPGGALTFLVNSYLLALCVPEEDNAAATDRLLRSAFELGRIDWPDGSTNFYLSHGDWIRLFRSNGFEIEDLVELRPAAGATTRYPFVPLDWARRWPCEEVWKVRRG